MAVNLKRWAILSASSGRIPKAERFSSISSLILWIILIRIRLYQWIGRHNFDLKPLNFEDILDLGGGFKQSDRMCNDGDLSVEPNDNV